MKQIGLICVLQPKQWVVNVNEMSPLQLVWTGESIASPSDADFIFLLEFALDKIGGPRLGLPVKASAIWDFANISSYSGEKGAVMTWMKLDQHGNKKDLRGLIAKCRFALKQT